MDRALASEAKGYGFDPRQAHTSSPGFREPAFKRGAQVRVEHHGDVPQEEPSQTGHIQGVVVDVHQTIGHEWNQAQPLLDEVAFGVDVM